MNKPENISNVQLESIIASAKTNNDESWAEVDEQMPQICNDSGFLNWARTNIDNKESGLRDLAATILEASDVVLSLDDVNKLKELMKDEEYSGFRAACALAKRISQPEIQGFKNLIRQKLEVFAKDEGVCEIANEYLESIGE